MPTVVQKYGGSSVADIHGIRTVARQVVDRRRAGDDVVVVVSAMGKTTDQLLAMAAEVSPGPPRREVDMLVTAGERISMALLSMAIHEAGEAAISFTGSQSGIITEDAHGGARIIDVQPVRIRESLAAGQIVIVAGYQGVSRKREVTTLGRGGSDTSAVALAAALGAVACEIYSDVDGVYSADPRVCPQARLIPRLSYEAMQTMAGAGAKVLNADAVEFARRAGIEIRARKTGDGSGRETVVSASGPSPPEVVAVVGARDVTWLRGRCADPWALLDAVAERCGRTLAADLRDDGEVSVLVRRVDVPEAGALEALAAQAGVAASSIAVVSVVGAAPLERPRVLAALRAHAGEGRSLFAAATSVSLPVELGRCDDIVRGLHDALVH